LARQVVENGDTDLDAIDAAIKAAQAVTDKRFAVRTTMVTVPRHQASIATLLGMLK